MYLSKSVFIFKEDTKGNIEHQELRLSATANSLEEASNLDYKDFKLEVIIDTSITYDLTQLFDEAGLFTDMVDANEWDIKYICAVHEAREANNIEQLENK